jgi:hypothetical protein
MEAAPRPRALKARAVFLCCSARLIAPVRLRVRFTRQAAGHGAEHYCRPRPGQRPPMTLTKWGAVEDCGRTANMRPPNRRPHVFIIARSQRVRPEVAGPMTSSATKQSRRPCTPRKRLWIASRSLSSDRATSRGSVGSQCIASACYCIPTVPVKLPSLPLLPLTLLVPYEYSVPPLTVNRPPPLPTTLVLRTSMPASEPPATRP